MSSKSREEDMQSYITDVIAWLQKYNYDPPSAPSWGSNNSDEEIADNIVKNCKWFIGSGGFKEYADSNIPSGEMPVESPDMILNGKVVTYTYRSGTCVVFVFEDWSSHSKYVHDALTVVEEHANKISGDSNDYLNVNVNYNEGDDPPTPPPIGGDD